MKLTPHRARMYLLLGALLIALPAIGQLYGGHTGKLLVASPNLKSPYFSEAVILLGHHSWSHAFGVIINRPIQVGQLKTDADNRKTRVPAYYGGPVDTGRSVFALKRQREGVKWFRYSDLPDDPQNTGIRVFSGYAGWMMLQLNREISRGQWNIIDYDPVLVFETPPDEIWPAARRRVLEARKIRTNNLI